MNRPIHILFILSCMLFSGVALALDTDGDGVPDQVTATIAAGELHTCAIDAVGVHCWGWNDYGQVTVPALTKPVAVTAGTSHTCALDDAGVHCWGYGYYGQTDVPALTNPTAVSAGGSHSCALDTTGVHCWGSNDYG